MHQVTSNFFFPVPVIPQTGLPGGGGAGAGKKASKLPGFFSLSAKLIRIHTQKKPFS